MFDPDLILSAFGISVLVSVILTFFYWMEMRRRQKLVDGIKASISKLNSKKSEFRTEYNLVRWNLRSRTPAARIIGQAEDYLFDVLMTWEGDQFTAVQKYLKHDSIQVRWARLKRVFEVD